MNQNIIRTVEHQAHGQKFQVNLCREQGALAAYAYRVDGDTFTPIAPRYVAGTDLQLHYADFDRRTEYLGQHLLDLSIADIDSREYTGRRDREAHRAMNRLAANPFSRPRP
jgi:hypothetical protein